MSAERHIERDPVFGCMLWTGPKDRDGYGYRGRSRAHIVAWIEAFGVVPEGFVLDHRCRRRRCVNVLHLEPVSQSENENRKSWRYRARQPKCPRGHDMAMNRMITPEGGVLCRECAKESK